MQHRVATPPLNTNDPNQACMYAEGDEIFNIVKDVSKKLNAAMKPFGSQVWPLIMRLGHEYRVAPNYVIANLFARESVWPSGLSPQERKQLRLLTELFYMAGKKVRVRDRQQGGTRGFLMPEDPKAMGKVFKELAKASAREFQKPLLRVFARLEAQAVPAVQKACSCLYGEECSKEDAEELFEADFIRGLDYNRLPVDRPQAMKALLTA